LVKKKKKKIIENRLVKTRRKINAPQTKKNRTCPWPTSFETGMAVISSNHFQTLFCQWIIILKMQKLIK